MRDYQSVWRSKFVLSLPILICVFSLLPFFSCGTQVDYSNPFDPRAPEEIRAKGTIIGWAKKENAEDHSNIRVWVQSANHLYGVTDAQGFYYILNVPVGRYTMEAKVDDPAFRPAQGSSAVEIKQQPCPSADLLKLLPQGTSPGDCVQAGKLEVQKPPQAPKILSLSSTSFSSLQVTFPKNPPEDEVKLYRIYIAAGNDPLQPVTEGEIDAPETEGDISFEIKELKPGITYTVALEAEDADGQRSEKSAPYFQQFIHPVPADNFKVANQGLTIQVPTAARLDRQGKNLYITNQEGSRGYLLAVSLEKDEVDTTIGEIEVGKSPLDMAVNPLKDELYVTNALDPRDGNTNGSLSRVDLTAHKENAVLKGLKFPKGVVVSEDGKTIFLLQKEVGLLTVISAQEMKILDNLKVGSRPDLLAILKGKLYITESKTGLVHVVEITDSTPGKIKLKYLKEVMVGSNPVSLTTVPERRMVLVANQNSGTVSVIDGATDQVSAVIPIGKSPKGIWAAKDYAYVVDEMGTLLMLSLEEMAQMKCTRLCQMISPNDPAHIAVSPNKQKVMVVGYNTGVITIFDFNGGEK